MLSSVSVVFVLSASAKAFPPLSPIPLSKETFYHVCTSSAAVPFMSNLVIVVFSFRASAIKTKPSSVISFATNIINEGSNINYESLVFMQLMLRSVIFLFAFIASVIFNSTSLPIFFACICLCLMKLCAAVVTTKVKFSATLFKIFFN